MGPQRNHEDKYQAVTAAGNKKGVKTKIFGVLLVFIGALDCMLSWRAGFEVSNFCNFLILAGILLFILGAVRQSGGRQEPEE